MGISYAAEVGVAFAFLFGVADAFGVDQIHDGLVCLQKFDETV